MEEYYKWQIEQLRATIAQQEKIINELLNDKVLKYKKEDITSSNF
jgi:hypothetical protein